MKLSKQIRTHPETVWGEFNNQLVRYLIPPDSPLESETIRREKPTPFTIEPHFSDNEFEWILTVMKASCNM